MLTSSTVWIPAMTVVIIVIAGITRLTTGPIQRCAMISVSMLLLILAVVADRLWLRIAYSLLCIAYTAVLWREHRRSRDGSDKESGP